MSITTIPAPVQMVTVSNIVETRSPEQMEALNSMVIEEKINNLYNESKTDESLGRDDLEEE